MHASVVNQNVWKKSRLEIGPGSCSHVPKNARCGTGAHMSSRAIMLNPGDATLSHKPKTKHSFAAQKQGEIFFLLFKERVSKPVEHAAASRMEPDYSLFSSQ